MSLRSSLFLDKVFSNHEKDEHNYSGQNALEPKTCRRDCWEGRTTQHLEDYLTNNGADDNPDYQEKRSHVSPLWVSGKELN
jgi:hypothetical protein